MDFGASSVDLPDGVEKENLHLGHRIDAVCCASVEQLSEILFGAEGGIVAHRNEMHVSDASAVRYGHILDDIGDDELLSFRLTEFDILYVDSLLDRSLDLGSEQ